MTKKSRSFFWRNQGKNYASEEENAYSNRTFHEFKTFIWHNGKPQAMRSYNDDLVMSLAIGCWVRDTALQVNKRELEYKKAMINSMYLTNTTLNTTIKGQDGYGNDIKDRQKEAKKQMMDLPWIYKG